ncbi:MULTISPECIES: hypothetical protein, partial [unclassified Lysobacter]|uniref:hypothetical protein n=1 Tax=unclassified Lysobacter TaxID=2635362 RepID=UPI001BE6EE74
MRLTDCRRARHLRDQEKPRPFAVGAFWFWSLFERSDNVSVIRFFSLVIPAFGRDSLFFARHSR